MSSRSGLALRALKNGREPLASMAYFCLTLLENRYGGRTAASKALVVDEAVLGKLGNLSTNRGDVSTARKITGDLTPFGAADTQWLEAAIRALIRRVRGDRLRPLTAKAHDEAVATTLRPHKFTRSQGLVPVGELGSDRCPLGSDARSLMCSRVVCAARQMRACGRTIKTISCVLGLSKPQILDFYRHAPFELFSVR